MYTRVLRGLYVCIYSWILKGLYVYLDIKGIVLIIKGNVCKFHKYFMTCSSGIMDRREGQECQKLFTVRIS